MTKENGGQAFPGYHGKCIYEDGMTLRDYFAGQVIFSIANEVIKQKDSMNVAAEIAYNFAAAMIVERNKQ